MTGQPEGEQRRFCRLRVSPPRAIDGVAALCRACHHNVSGIDGAVLTMCVAQAVGVAGMGVRVAGQEFSGRELARTAAVMRLTAQQLRRTAARVHASAAAARSQRTAARLRALGDAVLVQADAIMQRGGRLAPAIENDAQTLPPATDGERPLPGWGGVGW